MTTSLAHPIGRRPPAQMARDTGGPYSRPMRIARGPASDALRQAIR
ncbi:MAG: hypothetical protein AAGA93_19625 [Actinomycetota bacterium]